MDEMFVSVYLIDPATGGLKAYSDIQPRDGDLTSIAALSGTAGLLKKTAANTWELDTAVYATTAYADSLVVGLLDDRGNYDASPNMFPASGGSGSAGAIKKGDLWTISVAGTLGGVAVTAGDLVRALADTPGQTAGNWAVSETNIGYAALNASLLDGKIYVGNGSNIGTAVTPSGDITISNAGVTAIGASKVTNTMLAGSIALSKITITGTPDGTKFLRDDGSWQTGGSGGDLQDAYDASASTEILTDATRGALTIKRGSGADTDVVLEVQNGSAAAKFSVTGEGELVADKNIVIGSAAISTSATDGFIYLGSCAGKPTGTPTTKTGRTPLVYDSANEVFYAYTGGAWTFVGAKSSAFECPLGGAVADATYTMVAYATFAFRILGIYGLKHTSGTSTLTVKINTTAVTGLSSLSVTSTPQNATASADYDVAVGDAVNFTIASGSSPLDLLSSLKIARL